jgi:type 1 glutamine amidotransferase
VSGTATADEEGRFRVLIYTRTEGFHHDSILPAVQAISILGAQNGFAVDWTEDARSFSEESLSSYRVVIFLSTTGDVLDPAQQTAFERYIRGGNGFVGVHSASDTEYDWPWYGALVGAYFASHPEIQPASIRVEDRSHPSTAPLPDTWLRTDEWYDFRANPRGAVQVLASLDESSYSSGGMGADHPIAWYHEYDGGRAWYTGGGHTSESYAEPLFLLHILGGILYAAGEDAAL